MQPLPGERGPGCIILQNLPTQSTGRQIRLPAGKWFGLNATPASTATRLPRLTPCYADSHF